MVEKKIIEAAEVLARKQLGIEPKKEDIQDEKDLPEMLVEYIKTFDKELTEKFKGICANMAQRFGLRDLSEDTMLVIANKIHEEAQNGNLNSISKIAENKEIVNIAEKATIKQQRVEMIEKIIEGEISLEEKEISVKILGAALIATIDKEYENLDLSNDNEVDRVHSLEHVTNATRLISSHVDETGKIKKGVELGFLAGIVRSISLNKEMTLEEAKAFALTQLEKMNPEMAEQLIEDCRNANSQEEISKIIAKKFYDERSIRNGKEYQESFDEFFEKITSVKERSEKDREEIRRRAKLTPKERKEEDKQKQKSEEKRNDFVAQYKSLNEKINNKTIDYSELDRFIEELRVSEFKNFYQGVVRVLGQRAKEDNDSSLEDICKKYCEKDKNGENYGLPSVEEAKKGKVGTVEVKVVRTAPAVKTMDDEDDRSL